MHIQPATVGYSRVAPDTSVTKKKKKSGSALKKSPKASPAATAKCLQSRLSGGDFSSVPNFRVQLPSCGVSSLQYPDWRQFNQGGEAKSVNPQRPPTDDSPRRNFPSYAPSKFFVGERSVRVFTHRFSRENRSNKLWPSGGGVAAAAILPYARWFTEICGWGDVWRHMRAWASRRDLSWLFFLS